MNCVIAIMTVFYRSSAMDYVSTGMDDCFSALLVSLIA